MNKIKTLLLPLMFALPVGAVSLTFANANSSVETKPASAATSGVTNGSKRINVIVPSSTYVFDANAILHCGGISSSMSSGFDFVADTDIGTSTSKESQGVRKINFGGTDYYVATKELGPDFSTTYWNIEIWRSGDNGTKTWNKQTFEAGKVWLNKLNTVYYDGNSISNWGYYYKIALHTGLDLSNVAYDFKNNGNYYPSSSFNAVPEGYAFDGWYKDAEFTQAFNQSDLNGDINLYAKYKEVITHTVTFKDEDGTDLGTSTVGEGEAATYSGTTPTKEGSGNISYVFNGWVNENGEDMTSSLNAVSADLTVFASYRTVYATGRYIVGQGGWGVDKGLKMSSHNTHEYKGTIDLDVGSEIKIAYYNGTELTSYFGYYDVTPTSGAYPFLEKGTNSDQSNIKIKVAGRYTFYFTDELYDSSYKISVVYEDGKTALNLATKVMSYGGTDMVEDGLCSNRFIECRTLFLTLSDEEKEIFKGYASSEDAALLNAYQRYVTWATILDTDPWTNQDINSSKNLMKSISSSESAVFLTIMSSIIVCLAGGGIIYFLKKKHN